MTATPDDVAFAAQMACLLEASAPKPGNVSPGLQFGDASYEEFMASAVATGPIFARAGTMPVGETIRQAVESTARRTRSNTNLGIVLLLAPLARAALADGDAPLRERVSRVLSATTLADARETYTAIRLANPGGLGSADSQDVSGEPTVTLREAMALAAHRDTIAGEYAGDFAVTFEVGVPAVARARGDGLEWEDATLETFLTLLGAVPDTLIARRLGAERAAGVARQAGAALDAGGVRSNAGRAAIADLDRALRDANNGSNPGTTADLTAASLFVHLIDGGWP